MSTTQVCPQVIFPADYDPQSEFETPSRGYLGGVIVQAEDGSRYQVFFTDPTRLGQTLADDVRAGRPYYAEPGLIVLPEVTTESITKAVQALWQDGYFDHLKPL
jgi:hypothetical protein